MGISVRQWCAAGVILLCAAVSSAQAGLAFEKFYAYLNGVSRCGCLDPSNGSLTCFNALVNTCSGSVIGVATDCVGNCSGWPQVYWNGNIGYIFGVTVCNSLYIVGANGQSLLIATGYLSPT